MQLSLTKDEIESLKTALCENFDNDDISIVEFVNMLRGALTVHLQEIIAIVFDNIDTLGKCSSSE